MQLSAHVAARLILLEIIAKKLTYFDKKEKEKKAKAVKRNKGFCSGQYSGKISSDIPDSFVGVDKNALGRSKRRRDIERPAEIEGIDAHVDTHATFGRYQSVGIIYVCDAL